MMSKKAVFFDIDGTIFNFKVRVPEDTKAAIRELRNKGHLAFISTGRSLSYISEDILEVGFDGVLAGCGTYISYHGQELLNVVLSDQDMTLALKVFNDNKIFPIVEGRDWLYYDAGRYPEERKWGGANDPNFKRVLKPITGNEHSMEGNKFTIFINNEEQIRAVYENLSQSFDVIQHGSLYMEILPKGHNKGTSITDICSRLGIANEDTYAFGDSNNDLQMFEAAGTSVCMGNGTEDAKAAADYISLDMTEGGVRHALEHFGLIY